MAAGLARERASKGRDAAGLLRDYCVVVDFVLRALNSLVLRNADKLEFAGRAKSSVVGRTEVR